MHPINPSTICTLALLAGSSLALPNLHPRDDPPELTCDSGFTFSKGCQVTGEAKSFLQTDPNSDYDVIVNVYGPLKADGAHRDKLVDTATTRVSHADFKNNKPYTFAPIKGEKLNWEMNAMYTSMEGTGQEGKFNFRYGGGKTLNRDATFQASGTGGDPNLADSKNFYYATDALFDCCAKTTQ
ncbi:MAG: hypothetical protein Q9218_004342 [Villophora microphyllina]